MDQLIGCVAGIHAIFANALFSVTKRHPTQVNVLDFDRPSGITGNREFGFFRLQLWLFSIAHKDILVQRPATMVNMNNI